MSEKKKTRGVFGALMLKPTDRRPGAILLSWRKSGSTANQVCLIGGGQENGETDQQTLAREAQEEAKIQIQVGVMLGAPLVFGNDTAVCYLCEHLFGEPQPTDEALYHRYCTEEEIRQGWWKKPTSDGKEGDTASLSFEREQIRIVGPTDRLGRTGRMIWDVISLWHAPDESPNPNTLYPSLGLSDDGLWIVDTSDTVLRKYRRLDPFGKDGLMQLPS
jgi:8-oxo-dGTP pyrophosphatase MutT (NUDIX family)